MSSDFSLLESGVGINFDKVKCWSVLKTVVSLIFIVMDVDGRYFY